MESALSLSELLRTVKQVLKAAAPGTCWVQAEVGECRTNPSSGHCYLELVEKKEGSDSLKAKVKAMIWASDWFFLQSQFQEQTGAPLSVGQKILAEVEVSFHELYGFSLVIRDIDPSYTLGEWALQRKKVLDRLQREGILEMNRELPWPAIPQRLAVISSPTAAGYGDFMNQLANSPFAFYTRLYPAVVQGEQAEASLLQAFDRLLGDSERYCFDAVVIIRGGGATTDLSCFDTYGLCSALAQLPLPVLTGIGHERDKSVADQVANVSVKTPTAAAEFLIGCLQQEYDNRMLQARRLRECLADRRQTELLTLQRRQLELRQYALGRQRVGCQELQQRQALLQGLARQQLADERHRLELWRRDLSALSPEEQLRRGYTITLCEGKPVASAKALPVGKVLETRFADGSVWSVVEKASCNGDAD